jgi:hypothetical protein
MSLDLWIAAVTILTTLLASIVSIWPANRKWAKATWAASFVMLCIFTFVLQKRLSRATQEEIRTENQERQKAQDDLKSEIAKQGQNAVSEIHSEFAKPLTINPPSEVSQLCPRSLPWSLRKIPPAPEDNYGAEITVREVRGPMFRVHVFSRAFISRVSLQQAPKDGVSTSQLWPGSTGFVVGSTKGASVFSAFVYSSEELRVICVNQEN